jgi:hypothetical protein
LTNFGYKINHMTPSILTWRQAFGVQWARRLQAVLGYRTERGAWGAAVDGDAIGRRSLVMLQHHIRQKRNARAARLAQAIERAKKEVRTEDAALDTLLAWCESELAKKK